VRSAGVLFAACVWIGCASPENSAPFKFGEKGPQCGHGALDNDPHNCGECGFDCTKLPGVGSATCVQGVCQLTCAAGRADCSSAPGCEADLSSPQSCGACGTQCSDVCAPTATGFACQGDCAAPLADCGGQCVNLDSDNDHCGGCGQKCVAPANGQAICATGACALSCDSGFDLQNGACVSTTTPAGGWTPIASGTTSDLYSVWGAPTGELFVTGDEGTVLTAPRGGSFSAAFSSSLNQLYAVWGVDADQVLSVGFNNFDDGGAVFRPQTDGSWDGFGFFPVSLAAVWGSSFNNVYAVGQDGAILHSRGGTSWTLENGGTSQALWGVWGSAADDLYVVGANGTILYSDGLDWLDESSGTSTELLAVWGASAKELYAVGRGGVILTSTGNGSWSAETSGTTEDLFFVSGFGSDVWAVGRGGTILHRASGSWSAEPSGTTETLWSVWGSAQDGVFVVGNGGTILHR
jgi:hypothetical protein